MFIHDIGEFQGNISLFQINIHNLLKHWAIEKENP